MDMTIQGTPVPKLGFGTYTITGKECRQAVADALEIGYRHIDTAQIYENEEEVGQGIRDSGMSRDEVFLTTKVWRTNLQPEDVRKSHELSLRKLGVDTVDLLLIHWPNEEVPLEKTLEAMLKLKEQGKTRYIGVSNFTPELLQRALDITPLFSNQVEYHPFLGQEDLQQMAVENDLMLTAYSPLAQGRVVSDKTLQEIGEKYGKSAAQVSIRWLLQQENVAVIPRSTSHKHRRGNFEALDFELSEEEMARIAALPKDRRVVSPAWAPWRT